MCQLSSDIFHIQVNLDDSLEDNMIAIVQVSLQGL